MLSWFDCININIYSLRNLPLATVVSISFAAPIFTTIFSIFLLNEKVGFYRWLAVLVGFVGIMVISEPGFSSLNLYYIYPIIFCLGLSYVAISIRKLSTTEPVWLISFFFSFSIMILSFFYFLSKLDYAKFDRSIITINDRYIGRFSKSMVVSIL
jgi:drug/metabolite transporter (DMT)-like permease